MDKKLVAICTLLAAAASIAAEPPDAEAPAAQTTANAPSEPTATAPAQAATTPPVADAAAAPTATAENAADQPAADADVPKVDMQTVKDDTVCRAERPTGSRIAVKRCFSPRTAIDSARDDVMRRDIEEMRMRQVYQNQARDAAAAAAMARTPAR
jgi:hypothetical protein